VRDIAARKVDRVTEEMFATANSTVDLIHTSDYIHILLGELVSVKLLEILDALLPLLFTCLLLDISLTHPKVVADQDAPRARPRVYSHPPSSSADGSPLNLSYDVKSVGWHRAPYDARALAVAAHGIRHYPPQLDWRSSSSSS
jgi:hypothetical protein